jgi:hypothetical protein
VTPHTSYLVVDDEAIPPGISMPRPPVQLDLQVRRLPEGPPPTTNYQFDDDVLEGELVRPDGATLGARPQPAQQPAPPRPTVQAQEDFRSFDLSIAGDSGGGGGDGAQSAPSGGGGEQGRRLSTRLRTMREAERVDETPTESRFVNGRTYNLVNGMWIDARFRRSMRTMRVRTGTAAYFALVRVRLEVRRALTLGQQVTVVLDASRAVIVEEAASADVSADAVMEFAAP